LFSNWASDTISGGAGNDTLTLTAGGSGVNDTITGGAGNDIFFGTDANLVAGHVLSGGEGTDTLKIDDFAAVTDAQFENNTSIEVLTSDATGLSATLDVYAQAMGITTVTFAGTGTAGVGDTVTIQDDLQMQLQLILMN
jgi:Ca2+-binding RTX toxin-like protein